MAPPEGLEPSYPFQGLHEINSFAAYQLAHSGILKMIVYAGIAPAFHLGVRVILNTNRQYYCL